MAAPVVVVVAIDPVRLEPKLRKLLSRCLVSIADQRTDAGEQLVPEKVVLVVDSVLDQDRRDVHDIAQKCLRAPFDVLHNGRSRRQSGTGCWNTALVDILAQCPNDGKFVAFLDDDDAWTPAHLCQCLNAAARDNAEWVVSGLARVRPSPSDVGVIVKSSEQVPKTIEDLCESAFLCGNPGVQGSNLFVALRLIAEAGMFDESFRSCTDRDLCIRLLELSPKISVTSVVTVNHFVDDDHVRVSTSRDAKVSGFRRFWQQHSWRMDETDAEKYLRRCQQTFNISGADIRAVHDGCDVTEDEDVGLRCGTLVKTACGDCLQLPPLGKAAGSVMSTGPVPAAGMGEAAGSMMSARPAAAAGIGEAAGSMMSTRSAAAAGIGEADGSVMITPSVAAAGSGKGHRVMFGVITRDLGRIRGLICDIGSLGFHRSRVCVLLNRGRSPLESPQGDAADVAIEVLSQSTHSAYINHMTKFWVDSCHAAGSDDERARLVEALDAGSSFPIALARSILQHFMWSALSSREGEEFDIAVVLDDDKRLPPDFASSPSLLTDADKDVIYLGRDIGAAPNTLINGLRTQLRDLVSDLYRGTRLARDLPRTINQEARDALGHKFEDNYYDLSSSRFDHLHAEVPTLLRGMSLSEVRRHAGGIARDVLSGCPTSRCCMAPTEPEETSQRGGCMLLFRPKFGLLAVPQPALIHFSKAANGFSEEPMISRRSDSLWLIGQRAVAHPNLAVFHGLRPRDADAAAFAPAGSFDASAALRNFVAEAVGATLCRPQSQRRQYMTWRLARSAENVAAIRGSCKRLDAWASRHGVPEFAALADSVKALVEPSRWSQQVARVLRDRALQDRLATWDAAAVLGHFRSHGCAEGGVSLLIAGSQAAARLGSQARLVGAGCEGFVFVDETKSRAAKVFHSLGGGDGTIGELDGVKNGDVKLEVFQGVKDGDATVDALRTICAVGYLHASMHVSCQATGMLLIVLYHFQEGEQYRGGCGKALVELLWRLRKMGCAMTNFKPANIVKSAQGNLELVDLGRDWKPWSEENWRSMCRRAFACFRYGQWAGAAGGDDKLKRLLSRERQEGDDMPEITFFGDFFRMCQMGDLLAPLPVDLERFETTIPAASLLQRPTLHGLPILIKTCLMEHQTIVPDVRRMLRTLRLGGHDFVKRVLLVDQTYRKDLVRAHAEVNEDAFCSAVSTLLDDGLVTHVVWFDGSSTQGKELSKRTNSDVFGVPSCVASHSESKVPCVPLLATLLYDKIFEREPLVLQVDSDICFNFPTETRDDFIQRAVGLFKEDRAAVTVLAVPILNEAERTLQVHGLLDSVNPDTGVSYRAEIRCCVIHIGRLRDMLPLKVPPEELPNSSGDFALRRGWYRVLDHNIQASSGRFRSYRHVAGDTGAFFLHPPNALKAHSLRYQLLADRLCSLDARRMMLMPGEKSPSAAAWHAQKGYVDVRSSEFMRERGEAMIFVICGRNLPFGRSFRCLRSLVEQRGSLDVGVVLVDDASERKYEADVCMLFEAARKMFGARVSCITTPWHLGVMHVKHHVIGTVCFDPTSVIITLDMDDMLLKQPANHPSVIELLRTAFWTRENVSRVDCLVALGGMIRTSKPKEYPLHALEPTPRSAPAVGNVWAHLRAFRKFLFDLIAEEQLKHCDGGWIEHGADWAFMVPIVELAGADRVRDLGKEAFRLYLWEESTDHTSIEKHEGLERVRARLAESPPRRRLQAQEIREALFPSAIAHLPTRSLLNGVRIVTFPLCADGTGITFVVRNLDLLEGAVGVPVRLHSECFTGEACTSARCDCGHQLDQFLHRVMPASECAVLIYIHGHEGRGNGLWIKLKEYMMQDDDPGANHNDLLVQAGGKVDARSFGPAVALLRAYLAPSSVAVYTNNPQKAREFEDVFGESSVRRVPMPAPFSTFSHKYLSEKVGRGHDRTLTAHGCSPRAEDENHREGFDMVQLAPQDEAFARSLSGRKDPLDVLLACVQYMLKEHPFSNLPIIAQPSHDLRASPDGVCFDRNVFLVYGLLLHAALAHLFVDARVCGATTSVLAAQPEMRLLLQRGMQVDVNHIVAVVTLAGATEAERRCFLVDVGNGVPYFTPLELPRTSVFLAGRHAEDTVQDRVTQGEHGWLLYRLTRDESGGRFAVEHRRSGRAEFKTNYTLSDLAPLTAEQVRAVTERFRRDPHFSHMLWSVRINKWSPDGSGIAVKADARREMFELHEFQAQGLKQCIEMSSWSCLIETVREHFGDAHAEDLLRAQPMLMEYGKIMRHRS